jgi:hypothetical protein
MLNDWYPAADHCRNIFQLLLAADKLIGEFMCAERLRELDLDLRSGGQAVGQSSNQSRSHFCGQPGCASDLQPDFKAEFQSKFQKFVVWCQYG